MTTPTHAQQHIEVLRDLRIGVQMDAMYDPQGADKLAALDYALAALEAVEGAIKVDVADNAWIGCVPQHLAGTPVLIIPADAVEVGT